METIKEYKTKNYIVTVKKDYEELSPYDCFDKTEYDVKNICQKIDQGLINGLFYQLKLKNFVNAAIIIIKLNQAHWEVY